MTNTNETKRTNSKMLKLMLMVIMITLLASSVTAICNFESIQYYGACPYDGDVYVYDSQGNLIVKQLYSLNEGCYEGNYLMQVVGGPEQECVLNPGEQITFRINSQDVGYHVWGVDGQRLDLDLGAGPTLQQPVSPQWMSFVVGMAAVLILLWLLVKLARKLSH